MSLFEMVYKILVANGLVMSFMIIGLIMLVAHLLSKLINNRIAGSAIAIMLGLLSAYIGGRITGGSRGLADVTVFSGLGVMGGAMLRDYAIISTAFGARIEEIKRAGLPGIISLFIGIISAYIVGVLAALAFGYTDAVSAATIGAGTVTFIVGPVTGMALGASSKVITLSIAAGLVKSIAVMILTPLAAKYVGLDNPKSAMVYGGLMGTTSGTAAGLAATDPKLVPYGAMVATFYTGLGCLLCPSVLFLITDAFL